ncbi:hypothetical protein BV900_27190 [Agrobacterium tumefaciens]|nr:hypothetical protein BV900_27190 [Agrobacterium tumefaciens]
MLKIALSGETPVILPVPSSVTPGNLRVDADVILGIRPEAITDAGLADPHAKLMTHIEESSTVEPTRSDTFVTLKIYGVAVTARALRWT